MIHIHNAYKEKDLLNYMKVQYAEASVYSDKGLNDKKTTISANIVYYQSHSDPNIRLNRIISQFLPTEKANFYPVVYMTMNSLSTRAAARSFCNKALLATITDQLSRVLNDW